MRLLACLPTPADWRQKTERELSRAGFSLHAAEYMALRIILVILFAPAVFNLSGNLLVAALAAFAAAQLPPLFVKSAQQKRVVQFNNRLGDALTIMANSLRAGFSFMQAADTVSKEMSPPLALEFSRLLREIKLGVTTEDALQNMLERVNSRDLELLITAVKIQRQVGGNLAEILDNIGETIRERIRLKNEIKTLTAQGRISGLVIGLLPVLIIVIVSLINPGYMLMLITNPIGPFLLLWAAISEIIGIILIRRIVSLNY
ncbi:MAG TPA: secretion system protein [Firmicutes bacterium]|nr:secretion system protein [Bacillota bacterium]